MSDSGLCLVRTEHARFLSDTTHCPIMTSKSVCRTAVPDSGSGLKDNERSSHRVFLFTYLFLSCSRLGTAGQVSEAL